MQRTSANYTTKRDAKVKKPLPGRDSNPRPSHSIPPRLTKNLLRLGNWQNCAPCTPLWPFPFLSFSRRSPDLRRKLLSLRCLELANEAEFKYFQYPSYVLSKHWGYDWGKYFLLISWGRKLQSNSTFSLLYKITFYNSRTVTNAINILQACIYKSVKQAYFWNHLRPLALSNSTLSCFSAKELGN